MNRWLLNILRVPNIGEWWHWLRARTPFRIGTRQDMEEEIGTAAHGNSMLCNGRGGSMLLVHLLRLYTTITPSGLETTRAHVFVDRQSGGIMRPEELGVHIYQAANTYIVREPTIHANANNNNHHNAGSNLWMFYTSDTNFSDCAIRVLIETERELNGTGMRDWRMFIRRKVYHIRRELGARYAWRWLQWYESHFACSIDCSYATLWALTETASGGENTQTTTTIMSTVRGRLLCV